MLNQKDSANRKMRDKRLLMLKYAASALYDTVDFSKFVFGKLHYRLQKLIADIFLNVQLA